MSYTTYSDRPVVLTVSNKKGVNSGIEEVELIGINDSSTTGGGIYCGNAILDESQSTTGSDLTNSDSKDTNNSTVKFYMSPVNNTDTYANGSIKVKIKWKGLDLISGTGDETYSPEYTLSGITVYNAVDSIYITNDTYTVNTGEDLVINYTLRGELHNSTYLPVYNKEVLVTSEDISTLNGSSTTGSYTFNYSEPGTYNIKLEAQGAYLKPSKTITITVVGESGYFKLDISKLDVNKLK